MIKYYLIFLTLLITQSGFAQVGYEVIENEIELNSTKASPDSRYYQIKTVVLKKGDIFLAEVSSKDLIPRMVIMKNRVTMQPGMVDFSDKTNVKNFYPGERNCVWAVKVTEDGAHDLYISTSEVNKGGKILLSYASVSPTLLTEPKLFPINGNSELARTLQQALRHTLLNNMQAGVNTSQTGIIENPSMQFPHRKNLIRYTSVFDKLNFLPEKINTYQSTIYNGCYSTAKAKFDSLKTVLTAMLPAKDWKGKMTSVKSIFEDPCGDEFDAHSKVRFTETYHFYSKGYPELRRGNQTAFTAKKVIIVALRLAYQNKLKAPTVELDVYTADDETFALDPNNFEGITKSK